MNIQAAAALLKEGKFVRRHVWSDPTKHLSHEVNSLWVTEGWRSWQGGTNGSLSVEAKFVLHLDDLLANDWEEILPPSVKQADNPIGLEGAQSV